jgi:N-acetylmuramoyl-L-alanine amidase
MTNDDQRPMTDGANAGIETRRRRRTRQTENSNSSASSMVRREWLERLARWSLGASALTFIVAMITGVIGWWRPAQVVAIAPAPIQTFAPSFIPIPTATPRATPTPLPPLIALLAGHSGGIDTGAVCPDGSREVDITTDVAARAKTILETRGYRVEILAEFDRRLDAVKRNYAPNAFLAIHVDSCVDFASGYKVARAGNSAIPQEDDRLVRCVSSVYGATTQLPWHEGSITRDMTHYHGLMEIHPESPGAIIELGFLGSDKAILKTRRDAMALAIADGIVAFLRGDACQ